ncbi:hypothetical protein OG21DRAFT_1491154 [Imleria badia]|nr:hypothetical protein OG21DRAFT_1491154 [Imleria badia]
MADFFKVAAKDASAPTDVKSFPPHTIIAASMAIHLNIEPKFRCKSIEDIAELFELLDLRAALSNYVKQELTVDGHNLFHLFGRARQLSSDVNLPFTELQVWSKARFQQKSYYYSEDTFPQTFTVSAQPPDRNWKYG